jgi:hypothetical protein
MTDQTQTVREHLAFMKGLADDKDPLPWGFGAQLLAPGLLYAPTPFLAWANMSGVIDAPASWVQWSWVPAMLIHIAFCFYLVRREGSASFGPNKRVFSAAWSAMGATSIAVLIALGVASTKSDASLLLLWPPMACAIYGGAWTVIGIAHARLWHGAVAAGCFITAIVCASLIGSAEQWLALGVAVLAWIAAPGLFIMLQARAPRSA